MSGWHLLDRHVATERPDLGNDERLRAFEDVPYDERIAAASTYDVIRIAAAHAPHKPALVFLPSADPKEPGTSETYLELLANVTRAANVFHSLGVHSGAVVSLLLPQLSESFHALFGAEVAGIANPVNPLLEPGQITEILRAAGTRVLVTTSPQASAEIWDKVQYVRSQLPELTAVVCVGPGTPDLPGVFAWDALASREPGDRLVSGRRIGSGDVAAYFHTGGTTGLPKLVRHTHRNQVYQAWVMGLMLPSDTLLMGLPLFHVGGALCQVLGMFGVAATVVVLSPAGWRHPNAVRNVWKLVERFRPRLFAGVPTVLTAALNVPVDGADVSSIRCCSAGGSAIPVAVAQAFERQFEVPVLEVYGMTETSCIHTMSYPDRPVRLGSVGCAVPYSRLRVVERDEQGRWADCPPGRIGVVAMSGPGVFSGYLSEEHDRDAFIEPGWVNSGDLGRLDDDGYLWITGRAKDLIIRGGHNIDPAPVEEILFSHPAVALAAVVGEPDAHAGELPVAFVQLKPGATVDARELAGFVAEHTPERAAVPVQVYLIPAMPLTGVGKVFKPQLRIESAERKVQRMLEGIATAGVGLEIRAASHPVHGHVITVRVQGGGDSVAGEIHRRLDALAMRHEVVRV